MDDIIPAIEGLTGRVRAYRIARIVYMEMTMPPKILAPIEIKGLANLVSGARQGISDVRAAFSELGTESRGLKADAESITEQVRQHRDDLRFEASSLGNSSNEEEKVTVTKEEVGTISAEQEPPSSHSEGSGTASTEPGVN